MEEYDVIVIGAGNGGLTASATLAKGGKKVLLLERHNIPGGCATSFCRGRFEFEVALHQLSGMGSAEKPGPLRSSLKRLDVLDKLEFVEMSDLYRVTVPGLLDVVLPPNREELTAVLREKFPDEKDNIDKFFDFTYVFFEQLMRTSMARGKENISEKFPLYYKYSLKSCKDVLDEFFTDPLIKLLLSIYWSYEGQPPAMLSFGSLAAMLVAYIEFKPQHLLGGSQALSTVLANTIIQNGGTIRYNCGAKKITVENGRVTGVITDDDETIKINHVISNASYVNTYVDLIDGDHVSKETIDRLRGVKIGPSAFGIYLGLDCEPQDIGITESTNFICYNADIDAAYERFRILDTDKDFMLLTCYDVIHPDFSPKGTCQVMIVALKYCDPWLAVPATSYADEKYRCADMILGVAEKVFPDLRKYVEEMEISTPLTHMRFLSHPEGGIYGFDSYIKDLPLLFPLESSVEGLYHTGAWVSGGGFQPTLMHGIATGKSVMKQLRS